MTASPRFLDLSRIAQRKKSFRAVHLLKICKRLSGGLPLTRKNEIVPVGCLRRERMGLIRGEESNSGNIVKT